MWILRLFFIFCLPISMLRAASEFPRFEGDLSTLECEVNKRIYRAEKLNPDNPVHWAAVLAFEAEENPYVTVQTTPFAARRKPLEFFKISTPLGEYVFFQDGKPIGIIDLSDPFKNEETRALENIWWEEILNPGIPPSAERISPKKPTLHPETLAFLEARKATFKYASELPKDEVYIEIFRYLTTSVRNSGIGKAMLHMLRHLIIDPLIGKIFPIAVFKEGKYVQEWSPVPMGGIQSFIEWTNLPSIASQLSWGKCGVVMLQGYTPEDTPKGMFAVFYPPTKVCTAESLEMAKTVVAMEKELIEEDRKRTYLRVAHAGAYGWL